MNTKQRNTLAKQADWQTQSKAQLKKEVLRLRTLVSKLKQPSPR